MGLGLGLGLGRVRVRVRVGVRVWEKVSVVDLAVGMRGVHELLHDHKAVTPA